MEGVVIGLSILLAFWIDAAWELRRERAEALQHLEAVRDELVENLDVLEGSSRRCESKALPAIRHLLTLMGPSPSVIPVDSLTRLVARALRGNAPDLRTSAFDAMVSSGALAEVGSLALQQELRGWQTLVDGRRRRVEITSDEIVKMLDYLTSVGATPRIQEGSRVEMPASRFPLDVEALLKDPIFAGIIGNLGVRRGHVCQDDVGRRRQAEELVEFVSAELER